MTALIFDQSEIFCLYVDPFVSSRDICDALLKNNITPIALLSGSINYSEEEKKLRFPEEKFHSVIDLTTSTTEVILNQLSKLAIHYVIAGHEISLPISDHFANILCPDKANNKNTTSLRMDKFAMIESLTQKGMPGPKQIRMDSPLLTIEQRTYLETWSFPVIIKPTSQSGSRFVSQCANLFEVQNRLKNISQQLDNSTNVIQECLDGTEYYVNTVSWEGQHLVVSVHRYDKILYQNRPIYRYAEIVNPNSPEARESIAYVKKVLDIVDLRFGLAHTEIFLTADGPRLIEVNPRISGGHGFGNKLARLATGHTQAEILAQTIRDANSFTNFYQNPIDQLQQYGRVLYLQNWHPKNIGYPALERFSHLPSYQEHKFLKAVGQFTGTPESLLDTVILILLAHPNQQQIIDDYEYIMDCEQKGLLF